MSERKTLVIGPSWHGRLYRLWEQLGGKPLTPGSRENLCHYVRVVLFYAPLRWVLLTTPKWARWLSPAVPLAVVILLVGFLTGSVVGIAVGFQAMFLAFWLRPCLQPSLMHSLMDRLERFVGRFWPLFAAVLTGGLIFVLVTWTITSLLVIGGVLGCLIIVVVLGFVIAGIAELRDWRKRKHAGLTATAVAGAYLRARKARVCPFIEIAPEVEDQ